MYKARKKTEVGRAEGGVVMKGTQRQKSQCGEVKGRRGIKESCVRMNEGEGGGGAGFHSKGKEGTDGEKERKGRGNRPEEEREIGRASCRERVSSPV